MSNCVKGVGGVGVGENVFTLYDMRGSPLFFALLLLWPGLGLHSGLHTCNLPTFGPVCRVTGGRADDDLK